MTGISRRAAIAAAAAMTCTPGIAQAPDPILPALETFRIAQTALADATKKAVDLPQGQWLTASYVEANSELKAAYDDLKKAQLELLTTAPTTRAGLASLLIRLGQPTHTDQPSDDPGLLVEALCWHDEPTRKAASTVLSRLAELSLTIA